MRIFLWGVSREYKDLMVRTGKEWEKERLVQETHIEYSQ